MKPSYLGHTGIPLWLSALGTIGTIGACNTMGGKESKVALLRSETGGAFAQPLALVLRTNPFVRDLLSN